MVIDRGLIKTDQFEVSGLTPKWSGWETSLTIKYSNFDFWKQVEINLLNVATIINTVAKTIFLKSIWFPIKNGCIDRYQKSAQTPQSIFKIYQMIPKQLETIVT